MALNAEMEKFVDLMSKETGKGRDMDKARELSDKYILDHPEEFQDFEGLGAEEICDAASVLNAAGSAFEPAVVRLEMWVRSKFEPQQIGGQAQAQPRQIPAETVKGK